MTNKELKVKIKKFASKDKLTSEEWKEYQELVDLQYKMGANEPSEDDSTGDE